MARRREKGILEALAVSPWWVSLVVAAAVFLGCKAAPSFIHSDSPVLAGLNVFAGLLPSIAHYIALPFVLISGLAWFNAYRRRRLLDQQSDIESIRNLTWQEFEILVGEAFRRQGYAVEESGGGGADGGVDLRLRRDGKTFIVQCKRWKTCQVGVSPVRELYGLMTAEKANGAFFVSSGTYTSDASRFAEDNALTLIDGATLHEMIQGVQKVSQSVPIPENNAPVSPACPNCGGETVLRQAKRGANAGKEFWGCAAFPKCKGTVEIPNI